MYFGRFFFPCVDYTVVFNYSNTGIEIILCVYNSILQGSNQEEFTSGVYILLLRLFVQLPVSFPVLLCLVLKSIFHLILWFEMAF